MTYMKEKEQNFILLQIYLMDSLIEQNIQINIHLEECVSWEKNLIYKLEAAG